MKILLALILSAFTSFGATIYQINVGTAANDGTGDTLRSGFQKANTNFANLNTAISNITAGSSQATNYTTTNATKFGIFDQNVGGVLRFFGIEQGTNVVLYRNGSNVVLNANPGSGGSGSVTTNANQFGASTDLTLKDGVSLTNQIVNLRSNSLPSVAGGGYLTNRANHYFVETNASHILSNIIASTSSGDVVELGAGVFNLGTSTLVLPHGVSLIGQGPFSTFISGTASLFTNGPIVVPSSYSRVSDMAIVLTNSGAVYQAGYGFYSGIGQRGPTNALFENFRILNGQSDGIYMQASNYHSGIIRNGVIESKWDAYVQDGAHFASSNNWDMVNVKVTSDFNGATFPAAISAAKASPVRVSVGTLRMFNCDITSTNAPSTVAISVQSTNAQIYVYGGSFRSAGTNSAKLADNFDTSFDPAKTPIFVQGASINDADMTTGSSGSYFNNSFSNIVAKGGLTVVGNSTQGNIDAATITTSGAVDVGTDLSALRMSLLGVTASRALVTDAFNNVTNASGTPDGTKFLRDDNTYAVPSVSASTNLTTLAAGSLTAGTVIASNLVRVGQIDVLTNLNASTVTVTNSVTGPRANLGQVDVRTNANVGTLTVTNAVTIGGAVDMRSNATMYSLWVSNVTTLGGITTNKDNVWMEGNLKGANAAWFNTARAQTFIATNSIDAPLATAGQLEVRSNALASAFTSTNGYNALRGGYTLTTTNAGSATNVTQIVTNGPSFFTWLPACPSSSNTAHLAFSAPPATGSPAFQFWTEIQNTNLGSVTFNLPAYNTRGSTVAVLTGPTTNILQWLWTGASIVCLGWQDTVTGTGPLVQQTNATIYTPAITFNPGAISNLVQLGAGSLVISSNGGSLATVTQLVARAGIVVSNDASGTASLHVSTSSGGFAALEVQTNGTRSGLVTNVNWVQHQIGMGVTGAVSGSTATLGINGLMPWVNVRRFGATGDGSTDDTLSISNAIAACGSPATNVLYVPPGTYYCHPLVANAAGFQMVGDGSLITKFRLRSTTNNAIGLRATNYGCRVEGIWFLGTNYDYTGCSGTLLTTGLVINAIGGSIVDRCRFDGWNAGLSIVAKDSDSATRPNACFITRNFVTNCATGILLPYSVNDSEYINVSANHVMKCCRGVWNQVAGNLHFTANVLNDNVYSLLHASCGQSGNSVASVSKGNSHYVGNTINHGQTVIGYCGGASTSGPLFTQNSLLGGSQLVLDATDGALSGVTADGNKLGCDNLYFFGNVTNCSMSYNTISGGQTPNRVGWTRPDQCRMEENRNDATGAHVFESAFAPYTVFTGTAGGSSNYTISAKYDRRVAVCGTNAVITLPDATTKTWNSGGSADAFRGLTFTVYLQRTGATCRITNSTGSQNINGALFLDLASYGAATLTTDGTNWFRIGQ